MSGICVKFLRINSHYIIVIILTRILEYHINYISNFNTQSQVLNYAIVNVDFAMHGRKNTISGEHYGVDPRQLGRNIYIYIYPASHTYPT